MPRLCYVSMKYDSPCIDPVEDIIEAAAAEMDLETRLTRDRSHLAEAVREQCLRDIDDCLVVVCEGTAFSWFVAFELAYAIGRKPCILLVQDSPPPDCARAGESIRQLFPEKFCCPYSLRSKNSRRKVRQDLAGCLRRALDELSANARKLSTALAEADLYKTGKPPVHFVQPLICWQDEELLPEDLFRRWLDADGAHRLIALTSPPGGGKSLLLAKYREWAGRGPGVPVPTAPGPSATELPRLALLLNLGLLKQRLTREWPGDLLDEGLQQAAEAGKLPPLLCHGLLRSYRAAGLAYLLLDGLDEFGIRRKADVEPLLDRCHALAEEGWHVMVASRSWFWKNRITAKARDGFREARILPPNQGQAREMLMGISVPPCAQDSSCKLQRWLLSYLLLTFIRESQPTFESKTDLYEAWARWLAKDEFKRSADQVLEFLGQLAILVAENRTQEVSLGLVKKGMAAALPDRVQDAALSEEILTSRFFTPVSSAEKHVLSARFFHESVYEFFVARRLVNDFHSLLDPGSFQQDLRLALAQTALDYLPSSVYGFLYDKLGPTFEANLVTWLGALIELYRRQPQSTLGPPVELLRNAVEYLGMTSRGVDENLAVALSEVVKVSNFPEVIRYNAARSLERIHSSAPRPYFDFASDWHSEEGWKKHVQEDHLRPWAIRGAFQEKRKPGQYPAMVFDYSQPAVPRLQSAISAGLLEVLETGTEYYLRINVSHALLRWFDFRDLGADRRLEKLIQSVNQANEPETYDNLTIWLPMARDRFRALTNSTGKA